MSSATVAKHYARLVSLWPKDLLRPNHPFTKTIQHRAAKIAPLPSATTPATSPKDVSRSALKIASAESQNSEIPIPVSASSIPSVQAELKNINALYSLLENRYSKQYPITQAVLKPRSHPAYYDLLMKEIEESPNKSWIRAKMEQFKSRFRFMPPPGMTVH